MNKTAEIIPVIASFQEDGTMKKMRVCAYARVSTKKEEQESSLELQVSTYYKLITSHPHYEYAGIFADHGKSGTHTNRKQFLLMIEMCKLGAIDLILTKSISRFARNTMDSLTTILELRELGVEVFFERENISTKDPSFDVYVSVLSSMAEEESKQNSSNVLWSIKKNFERGIGYTTHLYGYDFNETGEYIINEKEAETVRLIFTMYKDRHTTKEIIEELHKRQIRTHTGLLKWAPYRIHFMLKNEKYVGDLLLQKKITPLVGLKSRHENSNKKTKYYVTNNHKGIISRELYQQVQDIMQERREKYKVQKGMKRANLTPYAKFVYSLQLNKYLKVKTNHRNTPKEVKYLTANEASSCKDFKPIYVNQIEIAMQEAFNKCSKNWYAVYKEIERQNHEMLEKSGLNSKIEQQATLLKEFEKKIAYASSLNVDEDAKKNIVNRLQENRIQAELQYVKLRYKKLIEYSIDMRFNLLKNKVKKANLTSESFRDIFDLIIAIDREHLLLCLKLSNQDLDTMELKVLQFNPSIVEGSFYFEQTRVKETIQWKVIII